MVDLLELLEFFGLVGMCVLISWCVVCVMLWLFVDIVVWVVMMVKNIGCIFYMVLLVVFGVLVYCYIYSDDFFVVVLVFNCGVGIEDVIGYFGNMVVMWL